MTISHPRPHPDQRVIAAREFLDGARRRKVDELPPSVLMREDAELRRLLGKLLDVVRDYEDTELDLEVTQITIAGGVLLAPADLRTLYSALADAIAYREPAEFCADCGDEGLCGAHESDLEKTNTYRALARALGIEAQR
jgi:hypothetical protein